MEPKENTPMPANPKPSDEVQLNIETVTPETEKAVPTTDVTQEQSKDQDANPEDNKGQQETIESEKSADTSETSDNEETTDEENPAAVEDNKGGDDPTDARDQVETINP